MYPESDASSVPWGFLSESLATTKSRLEDALAAIAGARASYVEITFSKSRGEGLPNEEYRVSVGETGMGLCPDAKIHEDDDVDVDGDTTASAQAGTLNVPSNTILQRLARFFSGNQSTQLRSYSPDYKPSPAYDIAQKIVFDIAQELAEKPDASDASVGVGAVISSTAGDECTKTKCEFRLLKLACYWRQYYPIDNLGNCGRRWTKDRCTRCNRIIELP